MEREISAAMLQRCGALMALVTRFHSNAFVERQHVLEACNMKASKSRSRSVTATFASILLAFVLVSGCAPRVIGTRQVPGGNDMATMIKNGATPYKDDVPAIALAGTGAYTTNFSATLRITSVVNTRMVMGETTSPVISAGGESRHISLVLYLCQPLSEKADKFSDGTVVYGGTGYPKIIEGQTYVISGILQPHWQGNPLVYVPAANEFKQTTGSESFVDVPKDALELEVPAMPSPEQVVRDYFKYWNAKNLVEMEKRLTPDKRGIAQHLDALAYVKILSISERLPKTTGTKVFEVVFDLKFKNASYGATGINDGKNVWGFFLKRDNEMSPWLVYDWGGGY
jgi:hypothetical protein